MIAAKAPRRKHLPKRVTVRFVPLDRATEFHQKRIADAAAFFYALGAKTTKGATHAQ